MKLRNKKTGEIVEPFGITCIDGRTFVQFDDGEGSFKFEAHSLAELNEEWEDYEETKLKDIYWIDNEGYVNHASNIDKDYFENNKEIGNYFETKEEAELVVEKLKAWKRLKDKGFRFKCCDDYHIDYEITGKCVWTDETEKDLDLLFGGEE